MPIPINVDEVASRLQAFPHDTYLYVGSFMRSVALAAGAFVLLEIVACKKYWWRLLPWSAAMMATTVTLTTWGRGVLFTNSRANIGDSILPLLMGVVEVCLFAILSPSEYWKRSDPPTIAFGSWRYFPFIHATHALLAVGLIINRLSQTSPEDFSPMLQPLGIDYVTWMKNDLRGAVAGVVVFSLLGVLALYLAKLHAKFQGRRRYGVEVAALAIIPMIIYLGVVYQSDKQRQRADTFVSDTLAGINTKPLNQGQALPPTKQGLN
jgi:hypothetical protein